MEKIISLIICFSLFYLTTATAEEIGRAHHIAMANKNEKALMYSINKLYKEKEFWLSKMYGLEHSDWNPFAAFIAAKVEEKGLDLKKPLVGDLKMARDMYKRCSTMSTNNLSMDYNFYKDIAKKKWQTINYIGENNRQLTAFENYLNINHTTNLEHIKITVSVDGNEIFLSYEDNIIVYGRGENYFEIEVPENLSKILRLRLETWNQDGANIHAEDIEARFIYWVSKIVYRAIETKYILSDKKKSFPEIAFLTSVLFSEYLKKLEQNNLTTDNSRVYQIVGEFLNSCGKKNRN